MPAPKLLPGEKDFGIYDLRDLPQHGLVRENDILTIQGSPRRRILPISPSTWRRQQALGEAPPSTFLFGARCQHVVHIRALLEGRDWKNVPLPKDAVAAE